MKVTRKTIESKYRLIIKKTERCISSGQQDNALRLLELAGSYLYKMNYKYMDEACERWICHLSASVRWDKNPEEKGKRIVFYDGFGFDTRGLALIYIKALLHNGYHITYIVNAKGFSQIPSIAEEIGKDSKSDIFFIKEQKGCHRMERIQNAVNAKGCNKFIFYSSPQDIVGIIIAESLKGLCLRYLINLTDHAFWLGIHAFDIYIEYRDYGASVSRYYRGIDKSKIKKLPFYPDLNKNIPFEGFPFELREGNKLVFSGGCLYKTFDRHLTYYRIIEEMLQKHPEVIFLYAGHGNRNELKRLAHTYKGRVFYIDERKDLYEIMKHSSLYLSTYPIAGGLMTQYAAAAGKVPLSLVYDDCSVGVLLKEDILENIFIKEKEKFREELERLLTDKNHLSEQEKLMENQLMTQECFEENLYRLFEHGSTDFSIVYNEKLDVSKFQKLYLSQVKRADIYGIFADKNQKWLMLKNFPCEFIQGVFYLFISKIKSLLGYQR